MEYKYDKHDIKRRLNENVDSFLCEILPNGKSQSQEFVVGSVDGEPGTSLKVCTQGDKLGVWKDFATGDSGGDLLSLLMTVRRCTFPEALDEAATWLGVEAGCAPVRSKPRAL